ncbi:hypothetical protein SPSIL_015120 [Sporomusa silvacetica DSM 10669]|uniref:Benzylsuccinate synthase beta subunit domain-containing protein n=1 Tax=Sporomusa silvacetica DSM 10669 TaxID=1123289 RepID=A0ABZ3II91_9FIRM|nr:hypothetical protein [Sporomusa silvacetica]OZC21574.1 hypothetical protein SPSIL_09850 [Sporomusa silvacetica DSM 10669]
MDNWKHRTSGMKCATCMWFAVKSKIGGCAMDANQCAPVAEGHKGDLGRCRRHAPKMSGFPATFETDWCGDHKLDENKI